MCSALRSASGYACSETFCRYEALYQTPIGGAASHSFYCEIKINATCLSETFVLGSAIAGCFIQNYYNIFFNPPLFASCTDTVKLLEA
jgi:hypothetical protein